MCYNHTHSYASVCSIFQIIPVGSHNSRSAHKTKLDIVLHQTQMIQLSRIAGTIINHTHTDIAPMTWKPITDVNVRRRPSCSITLVCNWPIIMAEVSKRLLANPRDPARRRRYVPGTANPLLLTQIDPRRNSRGYRVVLRKCLRDLLYWKLY